MGDFWPSGLELKDAASPMQILQSAAAEWDARSEGKLLLLLSSAKSDNGNEMILVHAKYVPKKRTATLFEVVHRPGAPYPVTIQPKGADLPNFLRKAYKQLPVTSMVNIARLMDGTTGATITNEWVADTPSEFRGKLTEVFNLGTTKGEILNLISGDALSDGLDESQTSEAEARE